jgi:hypothetical protein
MNLSRTKLSRQDWFGTQRKTFYTDGIRKIEDLWLMIQNESLLHRKITVTSTSVH